MSELDSPRVQPFYCPYCAEEDIVPCGALDDPPGGYHCRSCDRRYHLRYLGSGPGAPSAHPASKEAATS
ncbi:MAG TPA: hypothetical protein VKW77_10110 [Acidimicrobiales bacterium]|nr:hypothetical protein [Acidimicrobiales bacterium]HLJ07848.1 hypothetical protein [Acidimicrobiia bacterium]